MSDQKDVIKHISTLGQAHLPALVHGVDAGRLELLQLVASLVAGTEQQLVVGSAIRSENVGSQSQR